jgi:hypothetical protein
VEPGLCIVMSNEVIRYPVIAGRQAQNRRRLAWQRHCLCFPKKSPGRQLANQKHKKCEGPASVCEPLITFGSVVNTKQINAGL